MENGSEKNLEAFAGRCFVKVRVLKNLTKYTGKDLRRSIAGVSGLQPSTSLLKKLRRGCFFLNFGKRPETFLTEHLRATVSEKNGYLIKKSL